MLKFPIPDLMLGSIFELKPKHLKKKGVTLLLMDLDNTLAAYHCPSPSVPLRNWIDSLKRAGIEQVNQAIAQMDQVTQQNAALVEEAAAAADALQEQAQELNQVVGVFKL